MRDMSGDPILIWGGGAIGGTLAAYWARAGIPVLLVDIVTDHVVACRTRGLAIVTYSTCTSSTRSRRRIAISWSTSS